MGSFAEFASSFSELIWDDWLVYSLTGAGVLFTLVTALGRFRDTQGRNIFWRVLHSGIQFKALTHGFDVVRGKFDNPEDEGNISHFKALCTALSATIGLGNIAGVAVAVAAGGAGAVFWMWVVGFLGMATKFMTCSLGTMYRHEDSDGTYRGGPMYYIEIGLGKNWKWLGILFALLGVAASIGAGNMFQSNQVADIIRETMYQEFGLAPDAQTTVRYVVGGLMAALAGLVMIGGIKRIGNTASKVVPLMCVIYVGAAAWVILTHFTEVPGLLKSIVVDAWSGKAAGGAFMGIIIAETIKLGVKRACFSNEAGLGSAPMAHATAKTNEPIREGVVAALGPFIDTIVICTMTALVILITQSHMRPAVGEVVSVSGVRDVVVADDGKDPITKHQIEVQVRIAEEHAAEHAAVGASLLFLPTEEARNQRLKEQDEATGELPPSFAGVPAKVYEIGDDGLCKLLVEVPEDRSDWDLQSFPSLQMGNPAYLDKSGVTLTSYAFDKVIPGFGTWFLPFAAFMFAFSTVVSWGFYGETCLTYLLGEKVLLPFKLVYVTMVFIGAIFTQVKPVLDFSDAMLGLMLVPNLIGTILLAPRVMRATRDYFNRLERGEFDEEVRRAAEAKARLKGGD